MILNINLKNFRSFQNETSFTMIAESSKTKEQNVFIQSLSKGEDEIRLLNTAVIYGANASGKTNLLKAVNEITKFICRSEMKVGQNIRAYDPFRFNQNSLNAPTEFKIEFIGKDKIKYKYELVYNTKNIIKEELVYYPNNKPVNLFTRAFKEDIESIVHVGNLGSIFKNKEVEVFHNQAILSKFGEEVPNEIISEIYIYFSKITVINAFNTTQSTILKDKISDRVARDPLLLEKIDELIKISDTGINGINIDERPERETYIPPDLPEELRRKLLRQFRYSLYGRHSFYMDTTLLKEEAVLPFEQESSGTKVIFSLGGQILETIENGEILFVDELESSLHPFLSKLLVSLFQNKYINKKNAQLIFTTHDTILLDRTLFRKDQVWFAEKSEYGATNMYSLQDFNDVREDTPFDKWYLAGKFGGIPNIKSLESLYGE